MKKSVFDYTPEDLALTSFAEILSSLASEMQAAAGRFTCSIGLTELRPEDTPKSAFERVDKALYQAKESGRNCIRTADA